MHALIRGWALGLVRIFYPQRAVSGAGHVPASGPVIVVANHPNGLLDPLLVRIAVGQPVAFLAKSTFWQSPFFRTCMQAFGAFPAYRAHEADTSRNEETFAAVATMLAGGGWLALFPEGKSHDETTLQPLKTGAARIALRAAAALDPAAPPLRILPVGLCYNDKDIFRSAVAIAVGEPLTVEPGSPSDRAAVSALTARIAEALGEVVLQADDAALWRAFLAVARWSGASGLPEQEARARALAAHWRALLTTDPDAAEDIASQVRRFSRALAAVGVSDPFAIEEASPAAVAAGAVPLTFLALPGLLGAALYGLPYRLVRPLSYRLAKGHTDIVGTIKLLVGFLVLSVAWAGWVVAGAAWGGPWMALALAVVGPLCGWAAVSFEERLALRREALRGISLRLFRPKLALALVERRRELAEVVNARLGTEVRG